MHTPNSQSPQKDCFADIDKYPFPIAFAAKELTRGKDNATKFRALLNAYENVVKYIDLLLLSFYHQGIYGDNCESMFETMVKLETPKFEHWLQFLHQSLHKCDVDVPILQKLTTWYKKIEQEKKIYLQEIVDYQKQNREIGCLTNLQKIRRTALTTSYLMQEEEYEAYFSYCSSSLDYILSELLFLEKYPIYYIETTSSEKQEIIARKLSGADLAFKKVVFKSAQQLSPGHVYLLDKEHGNFYTLYPFLIYQECYYCIREERAHTWELFLWQGKTGQRLCYSGGFHKAALREHLSYYTQLLESHNHHPQKTKIESITDIWEIAFHSTKDTLLELRNNKIFQDYYPRREGEFILQNFVINPKFPLCLIMGASGTGKTVLMAEMAKRWASKGEIVFFLRIFGDRGLDLKNDISGLLGSEALWHQAQQIMNKAGKKWIIILDGIENTSNPQQLFASLRNFLQEYTSVVKIIIALNELFYATWETSLPKELCTPFDGACPIIESDQPFFYLTSFTLGELKDAYCSMAANIEGAPPSFSCISQKTRGMLRNPALAKLFLLCLRNREIPRHLRVRDVMEGFVVNHINCCKQRQKFLENFLKVAIERKTAVVNGDIIVESDNAVLISEALDFTIPSGIQELLHEGILERTLATYNKSNHMIVHFPLSILQKYFVYRTMALEGKHSDELLVTYLKDITNGNNALLGVVYFAFVRFLDKQYFERIVNILNKVENFHPVISHILYEVLTLKQNTSSRWPGEEGPINSFLEILLAKPSQTIIVALAKFSLYLYREEKFAAAAHLWEQLVPHAHNSPCPEPTVLLVLAAHSYQRAHRDKDALKAYKKCYRSVKKLENTDKEAEIYILVGQSHLELKDIERAESFLQKAYLQRDKFKGTPIEAKLYSSLGKISQWRGDYKKALDCFAHQHKILQKLGRNNESGEVLENMANVRQMTGETRKAIDLLQDATKLYSDMGYKKRLAFCQQKMGKLLMDLEELTQAHKLLLACIDILESLEEKEVLATTYLALGRLGEQLKGRESSTSYFNKALEILTEIEDELGIAQCYEKFGIVWLEQGKLDKANDYFQKALKVYQKRDEQTGLGNIYNHLGSLYQRREEFPQAIRYYKESLKIRQVLNDLKGCAEGYNNLAVALSQVRDFAAALRELEESRKLYEQLNDHKGTAQVKSTEALIFHLQGDNTKALEAYQECAKVLEKLTESRLLGAIYNRMGLIYKQRGNFYEALGHFANSAKIQEAIGDLAGLAASYNNMGLIYDAKNDYEKALEYYNKDLEITEKLGDKSGLATSYNNIAILHYNHNNYARSLWYLEKSIPLYEELNEEEMLKKVKERIRHVKEKL